MAPTDQLNEPLEQVLCRGRWRMQTVSPVAEIIDGAAAPDEIFPVVRKISLPRSCGLNDRRLA
jgi:hypothetical protein